MFVDTNLWHPEQLGYGMESCVTRGVVPPGVFEAAERKLRRMPAAAAEQLRWLEGELAERGGATWVVVTGHHPVYSAGDHGDSPAMLQQVWPLLRKYGADVYLSGHDHSLQLLTDGAVTFVVSGAGSKRGTLDPGHRHLSWSSDQGGFAALSVSPHALDVRFVGDDGRVLHRARISAGGRRPRP